MLQHDQPGNATPPIHVLGRGLDSPVRNPGSFRDPAGGVYHYRDRVFRYLTDEGAREFRELANSGLLKQLADSGAVIPTRELAGGEATELGLDPSIPLILEHEPIPFISYMYEWPFELLQTAALQYLTALRLSVEHGFILKDATAFNTQFRGSAPTMIDVASFEPHSPGRPWAGYAQFCRMFLNPLLLHSLTGEPYHHALRSSIEGIAPSELKRRLPFRRRLRKDIFIHVVAQAWMGNRFSGDVDALKSVANEQVSQKTLHKLIDQLERTISGLSRPGATSNWTDYEADCHYHDEAAAAKRHFVDSVLQERRPELVWDLGCNRGEYSALAASAGSYVVAMDGDEQVVGGVTRRTDMDHSRVLPLVMDLSNPSANQGWAQTERQGLSTRGPADLALVLALVHHLTLSGGVPLGGVVDWLADNARAAVIEFVPLDDPMAQRLLATRLHQPHGYDEPTFRRELERRFQVTRVESLPQSGRTLYAVTR
jgi:hypothetical protein